MQTDQYVRLTTTPTPYTRDLPNAGATGYRTKTYANRSIVTWDKDNPICADGDTTFVPNKFLEEITEEEFLVKKFIHKHYIKKYMVKAYGVQIDTTNVKLVAGQYFSNYHFRTATRGTVFLGCSFSWPIFLMYDMTGVYFINCYFEYPRTLCDETQPLINHNIKNCIGLHPNKMISAS